MSKIWTPLQESGYGGVTILVINGPSGTAQMLIGEGHQGPQEVPIACTMLDLGIVHHKSKAHASRTILIRCLLIQRKELDVSDRS